MYPYAAARTAGQPGRTGHPAHRIRAGDPQRRRNRCLGCLKPRLSHLHDWGTSPAASSLTNCCNVQMSLGITPVAKTCPKLRPGVKLADDDGAKPWPAGADLLGDHHGYLLRMRLEGGLDGIELGPQLGRGSYGKVFKGASALCVVLRDCLARSRDCRHEHLCAINLFGMESPGHQTAVALQQQPTALAFCIRRSLARRPGRCQGRGAHQRGQGGRD